jgi:hypothetical protein
MAAMSEVPEIEAHERCAGASCSCNDPYAKPKQRQFRAEVTPFSGPIAGTKGVSSTRTEGKRHSGDRPLSPAGEEFLAKLWRETESSLRYDLAKYGEVRRCDGASLGKLRERDRQEKAQPV